MLTVAPIMGALYVMFLPMIGFALLAQHLGKKTAAGTKSLASDVAATVGAEWRPGERLLHPASEELPEGRGAGAPRAEVRRRKSTK